MLPYLIGALAKLRRGEFDIDGETDWDLRDALGMWKRDEGLESLYAMLSAMKDIREFTPEENSEFSEN